MGDDSTDPHQVMAKALDTFLNGAARPREFGFALFVFRFGQIDGGRVSFVSNAARADMIAAVKEWLARAEGRIVETETKQ